MSEKLGRCGRPNMPRPYLKICDWDWIFGRAVKAISSLGIRAVAHGCTSSDKSAIRPCSNLAHELHTYLLNLWADFQLWSTKRANKFIFHIHIKVEKILKGRLDSIPSPSPSLKIYIMGLKLCVKTIVNKLLKTKKLVTTHSRPQKM